MQKNLKRASAMILSLAMAVQFGLTDSYYINANDEQPVEETKQAETTKVDESKNEPETPQEDSSEDNQAQTDDINQEKNQQSQDETTTTEKVTVEISYVTEEDGSTLMDSLTNTYGVGYRLDQDSNVFNPNHEKYVLDYAIINNDEGNKITKDQVTENGLSVASGMTSVKFVYKKSTVQKSHKAKKAQGTKMDSKGEDDSEDDIETASDSETYNLYHYALIPGKLMDSNESADSRWFGIGVTSISGVSNPSGLEYGIQSNFTYKQEGVVKTLYPDITYNGKTYKYAASGSENADKEGYYTLIPARVMIANGANAGNNSYNPTASGKTYHQDYTMVMNEKNIYTITYNVMDPGETTYGVLNDYSQRVDAGTSESKLKQPASKDVPNVKTDSEGNKYTFSGWYKDQACTVKANFDGSVNANTNYYGKYVAETYTVKYDSNGGSDVADKTLKYNDVVDTSQTPTKEGYIFDGWYYGDTKVTNQKYATLANNESTKEITLVAHWKENLKASANPVEKTYDGKSYGITVTTNVESATIRYWNKNTGKYDLTESPTKKNVTRDADGNITSLTVKYKVSKDGYNTVYGETTVKINPASVTVTAENKTKKYGETDPKLTTTVTGNLNNDKIDYSISRDAGEDVGDYTINVTGEANQGNYSVTYQPATLTITASDKMTLDSTLKGDSLTRTYNGEALSSTAKCNVEGAMIEYSTNNKDWSTDVPSITDVGELIVYAKATCPNYTDATCQYTLKVTPKAVTVKANDSGKVYGQNDPELTATVTGTLNDDTIDCSVSRDVGENVGKYAIKVTGEANQGNYTVTYESATFTITASNALTLTANNLKKEYNGEALNGEIKASVTEGTTIKYSVNGTDWTTEVPSITDVDKLIVKAKAENPNYETVYANYTMEVTPKAVTVTANDSGKTYGAKDPTLTATVSGTLNNDTVDYTLSRKSGDNVGTYKIIAKAKAKQGNYVVTCNPGTFTISKSNDFNLTANLNADNRSKEYDGNALVGGATASVMEGTTISYSLDGGTTWTTEVPSIKDVGTLNVVAKAENANYETKEVEYTLEVTPKAVTVKANDSGKVYGQTDPELTATVNGAINGDAIVYTLSRVEGENVGDYKINVTGEANQGNYTVTYNPATFTITASNAMTLESTLKGNSLTRTYNGEALSSAAKCSVEDATIEYSTNNKDWSTDVPSIKDVGQLKVYARATHPNYVIATCEYTLEVTPAVVTVKADNKTKVYGTKDPELTATVTGTIGDDKISYKLSRAKGENVGDHVINVTGNVTQGNYTVEYAPGTLTITPQSIVPDPENPDSYKGVTVNTPNDKEYNGKDQTWVPEVKDADGKALSSSDYKVSYDKEDRKNVTGTITVTITGTGNYTGTVTRIYQITPRSIKLTSDGGSKVYDGTPLKKPNVTMTGEFGEGEVTNVVAIGSVTKAGKSVKNTIAYTTHSNKGFKESNYKIEKSEGTLTITPQSIVPDPENPDSYKGVTVNTPNDKEYNGKDQTWVPEVKDADGKALSSSDYKVSYDKEDRKNVTGTITVTITGTGNYTGTVTRIYQITPRSIKLTSDGGSKVYDGTPLKKPNVTMTGEFGEGEVTNVVAIGSVTEAGKSVKNTIAYTTHSNKGFKESNYKIEKSEGTLTITQQSIVPDPENPDSYKGVKVNSPKDVEYDGKEHKWIPTVTDKNDKKLEAGKDYEVAYSTEDFTNVTGTITVTISGIGNYSGTVTRTYKVTPKEYTVTTESATKTYSGIALTAGGKVEGIVSGEVVIITTTGSQTEVGTSKNTYTLEWNSAVETNYTLAKESIGDLTITAKSIVPDDSDKTGITVSEPSDSKYDGKEHKEVLTVTDTKTGKELVAGTDYSVTYSSDLVNAGTVTIKVAGLGNYTGSFTKTYKITKRSVTLTSATVSKVYDGSALTNTSITVSGDGFVEGEGASYEVTGTQTEVGNSANSFEYKLNENTLASNYDITKVVGTLTITAAPAPVTPATPSTPSTPSSTTSTTPRTPSAPQVTTPAETVEKETTPKAEPKKEEKVEEEYTPKASPQYYWALINLICAILTVLFGLLLLISKRHKSEDDDEEDDDETKQQTNDDDEDKEQEKKRGLFTRVLAVLIAILSVVFFLVTEDMSLRWTWTDQWTIWMVVIGLVQIVVFFVGRKWKNVDDDEDEEEAQEA